MDASEITSQEMLDRLLGEGMISDEEYSRLSKSLHPDPNTPAKQSSKRSIEMAKCPHCEQPVVLDSAGRDRNTEVVKEVKGFLKKEVMYSCPHCERVLGFGFFIGGWVTGRP